MPPAWGPPCLRWARVVLGDLLGQRAQCLGQSSAARGMAGAARAPARRRGFLPVRSDGRTAGGARGCAAAWPGREAGRPRGFAAAAASASTPQPQAAASPTVVSLPPAPQALTLSALAARLDIATEDVAELLEDLGEPVASPDAKVARDVAELVALELGVDIVDERPATPVAAPSSATPSLRPPVCAVMGHVDHGKTTLLDTLRRSTITATEAGGITQHVGAFEVALGSYTSPFDYATFIDTPGHAAFADMRRRGAELVDVAVLVVSAVDGCMPQTAEAVAFLRESKTPFVVALSKVDMPNADPAMARRSLFETADVALEEFGGNIPCVEVAAPKGIGIDELMEQVFLLAEIAQSEGAVSSDLPFHGVIVDVRTEKGRGPVVTVVGTQGCLSIGDSVVAGFGYGRVRDVARPNACAFTRAEGAGPSKGTKKKKKAEAECAPPELKAGVAGEVTGWRTMPAAGDEVRVVRDESAARRVAEAREARRRQEVDEASWAASASEPEAARDDSSGDGGTPRKRRNRPSNRAMGQRKLEQRMKEAAARRAAEEALLNDVVLRVVAKGDTSGTAVALEAALQNLSGAIARVEIKSVGVGDITEADVDYARDAHAVVFGFGVKLPSGAATLAKSHGVEVICDRVVYKLLDAAGERLIQLSPKSRHEEVVGGGEVLATFQARKGGGSGATSRTAAGMRVRDGHIGTTAPADGRMHDGPPEFRVLRKGKEVHRGPAQALYHHKDEVNAIENGQECGITLQDFEAFEVGDRIECVTVVLMPPITEAVPGGGVRVVGAPHAHTEE